MTMYLVSIALLFFWAALFLWQKPSRLSRQLFCGIASLQLILLAGLRHTSIGPDTYAYKVYNFDPLMAVPWGRSLALLWAGLLGQPGIVDPGWAVAVKGFQLFSQDYQVFLFAISAAFIIPFGVFIYRYSPEPLMSFLIYSALFYNVYPMTAARQTIALALVVLVGYRFVVERRLLPFLVVSVLAFTIHKSSVCFLPFYFIATQRLSRKHVLTMLMLIPLTWIFRVQLMDLFSRSMGYVAYSGQWADAGARVFAAMLVLVVAVAMWRAPVVLRDHPDATAWFNAAFMALALTPLVFVQPVAMRIVQYYSLFLVLLVPGIASSFTNKYERALVYLVAAAFLVFLFARLNPQYLFFWQAS